MAITHLLIGAGKMGGALLSGWLEAGLVAPRKLAILDPNPGPQAIFAIERGAKHITSAADIPKSIQTVLLAVKPQLFSKIGPELGANLPPSAMIVSILAGTSLRRLDEAFEGRIVIRAMPNTPSSIGAGISAIYVDPNLAPEKIEEAETLLKPGGKVVRVVIGSAKLLDSTEETPETLRKNVTSPNGTTQAALDVLMGEDGGLSRMMILTVRAAFARAKKLAN